MSVIKESHGLDHAQCAGLIEVTEYEYHVGAHVDARGHSWEEGDEVKIFVGVDLEGKDWMATPAQYARMCADFDSVFGKKK